MVSWKTYNVTIWVLLFWKFTLQQSAQCELRLAGICTFYFEKNSLIPSSLFKHSYCLGLLFWKTRSIPSFLRRQSHSIGLLFWKKHLITFSCFTKWESAEKDSAPKSPTLHDVWTQTEMSTLNRTAFTYCKHVRYVIKHWF